MNHYGAVRIYRRQLSSCNNAASSLTLAYDGALLQTLEISSRASRGEYVYRIYKVPRHSLYAVITTE